MYKAIVFGSSGLLGSAIYNTYKKDEVIGVTSKDFDATDSFMVERWFHESEFKYLDIETIYICVGHVAGIVGQQNDEMYYKNLTMGMNLIDGIKECFNDNVKVVYYSSSCCYPKDIEVCKEDDFFKGKFEPSNEGYAFSKLAVQRYGEAKLGNNFLTIVPPNLYGENDNWDLETCHVLPALVTKLMNAKNNNVELLGHADIRREFLNSTDIAHITRKLLDKKIDVNLINVGRGSDVTIGSLANMIAQEIGFNKKIIFNGTSPGKKRKLLDITLLKNILGDELKFSEFDYNEVVKFMINKYVVNLF